jgi:hypothetical protein
MHVVNAVQLNNKTRETFLPNTSVTKSFDKDVSILDMHIGYMLRTLSGQYLGILSSLVTLHILTLITLIKKFTPVSIP